MRFLPFLLLLLSCSSKIFSEKWDYGTRKWYEERKREGEFKVLLKDEGCLNKLKERFRVKSSFTSTVAVVRLSRKELVEISKEDCVLYIEVPKPVYPKINSE